MAQGPDEVVKSPVHAGDATAAEAGAADSSEAIRSQIAQTRTEIGDTLDAIHTRLSPSRVITDARDSLADATIGRVARFAHRAEGSGGALLETVRQHPVPFALLMMAASGLVVRAMRQRQGDPEIGEIGLASAPRVPALRDYPESVAGPRLGPMHLLAAAATGAACWLTCRAWSGPTHLEHRDAEWARHGDAIL